jgi:hypothetical protein
MLILPYLNIILQLSCQDVMDVLIKAFLRPNRRNRLSLSHLMRLLLAMPRQIISPP